MRRDSIRSCIANLLHTLCCLRRCTRAIHDTYEKLEFSERNCVPTVVIEIDIMRDHFYIIFTNFYVNGNALSLTSSIRRNVCTCINFVKFIREIQILYSVAENVTCFDHAIYPKLDPVCRTEFRAESLPKPHCKRSSRFPSSEVSRSRKHSCDPYFASPMWSIWMNPYIVTMNSDKLRSSAIAYIVLGIFDIVIFTRTRMNIAWNYKCKFRRCSPASSSMKNQKLAWIDKHDSNVTAG